MTASSNRPTRKVSAGAVGGACAVVVLGIAQWIGAPEPPIGLEGAISVLVASVVAWLVPDANT